MSDAERAAMEPDEVEAGRDEADEMLGDLEPGEGERAGVKGGGPKSESSQTGPGPEN